MKSLKAIKLEAACWRLIENTVGRRQNWSGKRNDFIWTLNLDHESERTKFCLPQARGMGTCQSFSSWLPCRGLEWPSCCHQHWCLNVRSGVAKSYFHIIGRRRCIHTVHVAAFLALIGRLLGCMLRYVNWPRMYVLAPDW